MFVCMYAVVHHPFCVCGCGIPHSFSNHSEELFLATTPFQRPDSPEFNQRGRGDGDPFDPNYMSLHDEQQEGIEEEEGQGSDNTLDE